MIPKVLHLCWLGGDEYPPLIAKCIGSWKEKCPDYEIKIWNTKTFDITSSIWVQEAFEKKKYAFAADYIRLWAIYNYGGIYLDSDVEVVKKFDDLLELNSFMGFTYAADYEPAIIGAVAKQEWIEKCLRYYIDRHFVKQNGSLDIRPLPEIIKPILKKEYDLDTNEIWDKISIVMNGNLKLFPPDYFCPDTIVNGITNNSYTIHHFSFSWGTPILRYRSKVFKFIVKNRILFFIYSNTFQRVKKIVKNTFFKQDYHIFNHHNRK